MSKETQPISIIPCDTTLRDGAQDPRARLSVAKKLEIARRLDEWGMPYIEGGWPGANGIDTEFFQETKGLLRNSQLVAFGMTARIGVKPENDEGLNMLISSEVPVVTLVGKTWLQHVRRALKAEGLQNLDTIYRSVAYLTSPSLNREVFFDAEHWFDGFAQDPQYAMAALEAAKQGGATTLVLCDTRGGSTPEFIYKATRAVRKRFPNVILGIHTHNDCDLAVINTIAAVKARATLIQGTINGVGERTGNADLCVVLSNAKLKYGLRSNLDLQQVFDVAQFIAEQIEIPVPDNNPYTGKQAFTHKAGLHASGMERDPESYEHINPSLVGNKRFYVMSEQGGSTNVEIMARKHGFELSRNDPAFTNIVNEMKRLKILGDAQEYLLLHQELGSGILPFSVLDGSQVTDERGLTPKANIIVQVNGEKFSSSALGNGLINAFDNALKEALMHKYPEVCDVTIGDRPEDYQVTGSKNGAGAGTAEEVEVFVRFVCKNESWTSRVRGTDQQRAGEDAIIDGYRYWILKSRQQSVLV